MFVILAAGFLVAFAAAITEVVARPPLWLHLVLWLPLAAALCLGLLRPFKGVLLALQHHHGELRRGTDDRG